MNRAEFIAALDEVLKAFEGKTDCSVAIARALQKKRVGLHPHLNIQYSIIEWLLHEGKEGLVAIRKKLPYIVDEAKYYEERLSDPV